MKYLPTLALAVLVVAFVAMCTTVTFFQDDAYITLAYARNLVDGHGLVFNIDEHVEGCTSLLWTLIAAVAVKTSDSPESILRWIGIICSALTAIPLFRTSRTLLRESGTEESVAPWLAVLAPLLFLSTSALHMWAVSGMEVGLFCLLTAGTLCSYIQNPDGLRWQIALSIAIVTRPEAMLLLIFLGVWHIAQSARKANAARHLALPVLTLVALTCWRFITFGALLPNTFSAKTGGMFDGVVPGVDYVLDYMKYVMVFGVLQILVYVGVGFKRSTTNALMALNLVWIAAVAVLGGDVLRHERFMLPILAAFIPMVPLALFGALRFVGSTRQRVITSVGIACIIAVAMYTLELGSIDKTITMENELTEKMRRTGIWLHTYSIEKSQPLTVAATTIGALKYFSDATVIDMLGLTDATIARNPEFIDAVSSDTSVTWKEKKYNASYVLGRKPDFIIFSTGVKPSAYAERALWARQAWVDYYFYYYELPETGSLQAMLRRKPTRDLQPVAITESQLHNVLQYPTAVSLMPSEKSDELFRRMIADGPGNYSQPYQCVGEYLYTNGKPDSAAVYYLRALSIDRYDVRSHYGMFQYAQYKRDSTLLDIHGSALSKINPVMLKR